MKPFYLLLASVAACSTMGGASHVELTNTETMQASGDESDDPMAAVRRQAADYACSRIGQKELWGGKKRYHFDSVGLVRAAFSEVGIDVFDAPALLDPQRTGVDVVYQYVANNGRLHNRRVPQKGDVVFFGKTRDANGDGTLDPISHLGLVCDVSEGGTATIVTTTLTQIVLLRMNRLHPREKTGENGEVLNGALVTLYQPHETQLTSSLFYSFGAIIH